MIPGERKSPQRMAENEIPDYIVEEEDSEGVELDFSE